MVNPNKCPLCDKLDTVEHVFFCLKVFEERMQGLTKEENFEERKKEERLRKEIVRKAAKIWRYTKKSEGKTK